MQQLLNEFVEVYILLKSPLKKEINCLEGFPATAISYNRYQWNATVKAKQEPSWIFAVGLSCPEEKTPYCLEYLK